MERLNRTDLNSEVQASRIAWERISETLWAAMFSSNLTSVDCQGSNADATVLHMDAFSRLTGELWMWNRDCE